MEKRRGSRKMLRLAPPTPGLRREGGKFHGLHLVNHVAGLRRMRKLPSLVQQATNTRKVQSTTTRSNIDCMLLACYPLPRHQL
jgi:hypothetical protein